MARIISIDIDTDSINMVEAGKSYNKIKVLNTFIVNSPENSVQDGFLRNKSSLAETIKKLLLDNKIKTRNVVFPISSTKIITREIVIPFVPLNKLGTVIKLNVSEYLPVNTNDFVVDYKLMETIGLGSERQLRVLIAAAPLSLVADYNELANILNLKVKTLDYAGNSIYQLMKKQEIKGTYIAIGLGMQSTLVTIMKDDKLELQKAIPFGTDEIYKTVIERFGISSEEAVSMLAKKPMLTRLTDSRDSSKEAVLAAINTILGGVNRILDYYISRNQDKVFEQILIYDNGAQIIEMDKFVERYFNITTVVKDKLSNVGFDRKYKYNFNPILSITAIGALIDPFNLKVRKSDRVTSSSDALVYILSLGLVGIVLVSSVTLPLLQKTILKGDRLSLNTKIDNIIEIEEIVNNKIELEKKLVTRTTIETLSTSYSNEVLAVIKEMEKNMPINTIFVSMTVNTEGLIYNTSATDMATIAKLIQEMKKIEYFSAVTTTGFTFKEDAEIFEVLINEKGEQIKSDTRAVDLYDITLACQFKTPLDTITDELGGK